MRSIWSDFLSILKEELGTQAVETWFKAVSLGNCDPNSGQVYLIAPNKFVKDWISSNYKEAIETQFARLLNLKSVTATISYNNGVKAEDKTQKKTGDEPSQNKEPYNDILKKMQLHSAFKRERRK